MTLEQYIQAVWRGEITVPLSTYATELPVAYERCCREEHEGWRCTLAVGHGGYHEAYGGGTEPYCIWS